MKNIDNGTKYLKIKTYSHNTIIISFCNVFLDQRNLGMSMKIERSSLDQVKKRFESNKKKLEEKKKDYDLEQRLRELKEEVIEKVSDIFINLIIC